MSVLLICAIFAPLLAPHDPRAINLLDSRIAPGSTWTYLLGTDIMGRDILSRLIYGAQTTAKISLLALAVGMVIGTVLGLVSGYEGGVLDAVIMRLVDAALGFPTILAALIVVVVLGTGIEAIILAMVITVCGPFRPDDTRRRHRGPGPRLRYSGQDYRGEHAENLVRHIFPNTVNTLMVVSSILVGQVILLEASLSFLGMGLEPGAPAWGVMVSDGKAVITNMWWLSLFPGLAITIVVLALNFFGDWLRDTLDPKLRRSG